MEQSEVDKSCASSEYGAQLTRNRSFKSKQLVRSQAIRESTSPPRTLSPFSNDETNTTANAVTNNDVKNATSTENTGHSDTSSHSDRCSLNNEKKQPVEIQITSGSWEADAPSSQRLRTRRWLGHRHHSDSSRDLLSHGPRVACVCGACDCPHCRGRRRRHACPTKQDSGIVCSDDCPDCLESDHAGPNGDSARKSGSLDTEDQTFYCRCTDRKEKPKSISLSGNEFEDKTELTGPELVVFIKETLNKNPRDRSTLLRIEKELHGLVTDTGRCIVRFPVMTSYGRMLVHRCAALFQLAHHLDHSNKNSVLVSKSGTRGGCLPCTSFREWCSTVFPKSPTHEETLAKSILKRCAGAHGAASSAAAGRSKSLEQRERDYERVRRRIFSTDNCTQDESQWPWLAAGPVRLLTADAGRNKLLKVQSLESRSSVRGVVSKSHSFGGYTDPQQRLLSRQGDLASSSWRLSPSSSGYKTLSLRSTDSVTPSPTGGASPEPAVGAPGAAGVGGGAPGAPLAPGALVWAVTDLAAVPRGALVIHPQTGRPLTNPDGSLYHFDPDHPPPLYDSGAHARAPAPPLGPALTACPGQSDGTADRRRGKLEKQQSFIDNECEFQAARDKHSDYTEDDEKSTQTESKTPSIRASPKKTQKTYEEHVNKMSSLELNQQLKPTPYNKPQFENQVQKSPIKEKNQDKTSEPTNQTQSVQTFNSPVHQAPTVPRFDSPVHQAPSVPRFDSPVHQAPSLPRFDSPVHQAPSVPRFDSPVHQAPSVPRFDSPVHQAPSVPIFDSPVHQGLSVPRFDSPVHQAPTVQKFDSPVHHTPSVQRFDSPVHEVPSVQRFPSPAHQLHSVPKYESPAIQTQSITRFESSANQASTIQRFDSPANHQVPAIQRFDSPANQAPAIQRFDSPANQGPHMQRFDSPASQRQYDSNRFEMSNQRSFENRTIEMQRKMQEDVFQQNYVQGYRSEEMITRSNKMEYIEEEEEGMEEEECQGNEKKVVSQQMMVNYQPDMAELQMMQTKMTPVPIQDPNMRGVPVAGHPGYYQPVQNYQYVPCRVDQPLQQLQPQMYQLQTEDQKQLPATDNTFRIDPSYPYSADFNAACGACEPAPAPRGYSVQYQPEPVLYPNVQYQPVQHYSYQDQMQMQWQSVAPKVVMHDVYPLVYPGVYPQYNLVYPQMMPQYPMQQYQDRRKKRHERERDAERQSEIAMKIQQIRRQVEMMNDRGRGGSGLLGSAPAAMGGRMTDEVQLSSAARAIVNSIRNIQAKNHYTDPRCSPPRPDTRRRPPAVYRQMSPGAWCRSPGPVAPAFSHPRQPQPDARQPRR